MASQDRSSSLAPSLRRPSDAERPPGKRSNITRVRTGCFTCRKRKKKCDEQKPTCANCQKTGVVCEGFPQQVHWEARAALRRGESDMSMSAMPMSNGMQNPMAGQHQNPDFGMALMHNRVPDQQIPPPLDYGYIFDPHLANVDSFFDPLNGTPVQSHATGNFNFGEPRDMTLAGGRGSAVNQAQYHMYNGGQELASQRTYIPKQLPFLIPGVDTEIHQRLFCHFTRNLAQVLTISIGDANPMNGVVIPLALRDKTIMDTILSLAGSHLLKLNEGGGEGYLHEIRSERFRLHENVVNAQSFRMQLLENTADVGAMAPAHEPDREAIFATSLLLCLYEIVEGTSDNGWRTHLDAARKVIMKAVEAVSPENDPPTPSTYSENQVTEIDPFLIEYFLYHDSLAAVTVPSLQLTKLQSADLQNHDPTMIGVQDGLSDFISRISTLRHQAAFNQHQPDGNVIAKAVLIWEDLARWQPDDCISTERKMIAEFYQWALYIWLFSIVYPDGKEDPKVQEAVSRIAGEMSNIKYGDSVMSCLLFPLFVIGSAAIKREDRDVVSAQFERLNAWSRLGNVDLTYQVVQKMWDDHDRGMPRSWDWVKQLETRGRSLLVT